MKPLKLIALAALALLFSQCKTTAPTAPTSGASVLEVTRTLDTVYAKFYELAQSHLGSSPGQVLQLTADWIKMQPNVKNVFFFDSAYLDIELNSGLRTTFMINLIGPDSLSLYRGGGSHGSRGHLTPSTKSKNAIPNKNVLVFAPFNDCGADGDLYAKGELDQLVNIFKNSGQGFTVTLPQCDKCKTTTVESFGNYGLVIISTHGVPDGFLTGDIITGFHESESTDKQIKEILDYQMPDGYNKVVNGNFRFAVLENIGNVIGWQTFLKKITSLAYRIMVNSKFINSLPSMPNTIILGNMCYSGWNNVGITTLPQRGQVNVEQPIRMAFTSKQVISYYSYGYDNGESAVVDNDFAKRMEDSLLHELVIDGDSTGNAYLNPTGQEFTASQLTLPTKSPFSPDLPFKHFGADDYSYDNCVNVFTDNRDGIIYKAVCIGNQTWMAENLRYNAPGSYCYDNNTSNCDIYGRLYNWNTVMNGAAATNTNPSNVQGICPNGWHVPSDAEWIEMINVLGGTNVAGGKLKATTLWNQPNTGATNVSGFSALPAGFGLENPGIAFTYIGDAAYLCSVSELTPGIYGSGFNLQRDGTAVASVALREQTQYESCRCVKDK